MFLKLGMRYSSTKEAKKVAGKVKDALIQLSNLPGFSQPSLELDGIQISVADQNRQQCISRRGCSGFLQVWTQTWVCFPLSRTPGQDQEYRVETGTEQVHRKLWLLCAWFVFTALSGLRHAWDSLFTLNSPTHRWEYSLENTLVQQNWFCDHIYSGTKQIIQMELDNLNSPCSVSVRVVLLG